MKLLDFDKSHRAMTLVDVLIVIATAFLAVTFLLLPRGPTARTRATRINCVNNLKQVGLGFRLWSNEHSEQFPWNSPATNGGTAQFARTREVWRHFEIASNEMNSPRILSCPQDLKRSRASTWEPRIS